MIKNRFHKNKLIKFLFWRKKSAKKICINILTRTSNRPLGFKKCHTSITSQSYKNIKHIVSYDCPEDLGYLNHYNIEIVKVEKSMAPKETPIGLRDFKYYNLYCNDLLNKVSDGWIMFLDDDDMLSNSSVIKKIVRHIKKADEDTLFIWQSQFPNGHVIPSHKTFKEEKIKLQHIDTACFIFHSKYKHLAKWDCWWAADYRFIKQLSQVIPNQKWIQKAFTRKNNFGDQGNRNDIPM